MKIAFATLYDTKDIRRGSGTFYHMSLEIERQGHKVYYIGPIEFKYPLISRILRFLHIKFGKRYLTYLDPFVGRLTGKEVAKRLNKLDYDLLITNDFAIAGFTKINKPIVIYTDVMVTKNYIEKNLPYCRLSNLSSISLMLIRRTIKRGLRRAKLCVFPTKWAMVEALKYYNVPSKITVIPFGANIEDPGPDVAKNRSFSKIIQKGRIDLLFVGKDWARKGGDIAVKMTNELQNRKVNAFLHIVGATPPYAVDGNYIKVYGYLDKTVEREQRILEELYISCDAFILPSSSEGFVIVVLEAAAYGLPVLAYDTIGVADAVKNGETGVLFKLSQTDVAFANAIEAWFVNPAFYDHLVVSARRYYEEVVNWKTCISTLFEKIKTL